jgi:hypothetical protein
MPIYGKILYNKNNDSYGFWQPNPLSPVNLPPATSLISHNHEPYSALKSRFTGMYPMNEQSLPIKVGTVFRCHPDNLLHRGFIPCMIMQKDGLKRLTIMLQLILGTSIRAKQIVKHIMYNYSSWGSFNLKNQVYDLHVQNVGIDPAPYIRPMSAMKYTSSPQWSMYDDVASPFANSSSTGTALVISTSKFMADISVHNKINNALTCPLIAEDILTNIEFKEPRVFDREMLYDSVYPRLLYMHVMKETGLPINYKNLCLKVMPRALPRRNIERTVCRSIYQGFGMHKFSNCWTIDDDLRNTVNSMCLDIKYQYYSLSDYHYKKLLGSNTLNWLNLASSILDMCTIITTGKVSVELLALLCKTLMNIADKYDVSAFMDAWEFLCEKHFKEEDQEAMVETLYTALNVSRDTKDEKHWFKTYDTMKTTIRRDELSRSVLTWLSTRYLRFNSIYKRISSPQRDDNTQSEDKTSDDLANKIIIKTFIPGLSSMMPVAYSISYTRYNSKNLHLGPFNHGKLRKAMSTLCGNEVRGALNSLFTELNVQGSSIKLNRLLTTDTTPPDGWCPDNRHHFTDICTWLSTYYVEKNWEKTANKTRMELIREFRNLDDLYPDMDTKEISSY